MNGDEEQEVNRKTKVSREGCTCYPELALAGQHRANCNGMSEVPSPMNTSRQLTRLRCISSLAPKCPAEQWNFLRKIIHSVKEPAL